MIISGFKKKATALSQQKGCEEIAGWIKSMSNHLHWCASSTPEADGELVLAKWLSIVNHMHNIHDNHSEQFPSCVHSELGEAGRLRNGWNLVCIITIFMSLFLVFSSFLNKNRLMRWYQG